MSNGPIAFIDSGIGGLPYLARARAQMPSERFVYAADNGNFPYGEKSADAVRDVVINLVGRVIRRFDPRVVVVACNTATVIALESLRATFPLPFVGVVPAVKPAAERSPFRRIGLLATSRTVGDAYLERLIRSFAADCTVVRMAGVELVDFVENRFLDDESASSERTIRRIVEQVRQENIDSLVLGCTHFTFLDQVFRKELGTEVAIVDSRDGVARQLRRVSGDGCGESNGNPGGLLFHTGAGDSRYRRFAERFELEYGGILD
ncbi:MAG TPA: glutamate racemase [Spirochaetia bacterium]|nr:glutamate racemase [Spirochaetia bacterium]